MNSNSNLIVIGLCRPTQEHSCLLTRGPLFPDGPGKPGGPGGPWWQKIKTIKAKIQHKDSTTSLNQTNSSCWWLSGSRSLSSWKLIPKVQAHVFLALLNIRSCLEIILCLRNWRQSRLIQICLSKIYKGRRANAHELETCLMYFKTKNKG